MRIKSTTLSTLSTLSDAPAPDRIGARAARIRQTLQDGLYQVDLDQLAGRLVETREGAGEPTANDLLAPSAIIPAA